LYYTLGFINKLYMPPGQSYEPIGYGAGIHTNVVSDSGDFTLRYTISVVPPPTLAGAQVEQESGPPCTSNLPITSVTSSGSQSTFPPTNAIDNNPNTKWISTFIRNPYIRLDLGTQKSVCGVDIAWADGASHQYYFNVSTSTDGTHFANVLPGTSSGTTTSPEKYSFVAPQLARYVKITITQSTPGSANSIAQISEINVYS
jgi:F5/8 type C domain-containing protein